MEYCHREHGLKRFRIPTNGKQPATPASTRLEDIFTSVQGVLIYVGPHISTSQWINSTELSVSEKKTYQHTGTFLVVDEGLDEVLFTVVR